jgi:hypothetical protein
VVLGRVAVGFRVSSVDFHFSKWVTKGAYGSVYIANKVGRMRCDLAAL